MVKQVFPQSMRASRVKTSMTPTKLVLAEYADRILSAAAGEPIPPTLGLRLENYVKKSDDECPPVIVNMRKLTEIRQSTWKQWVDEYEAVLLRKSRWREHWMYFTRSRYFLVEYDYIKNIFSESIIYTNRDAAMRAYNTPPIQWIAVHSAEEGMKVPSVS